MVRIFTALINKFDTFIDFMSKIVCLYKHKINLYLPKVFLDIMGMTCIVTLEVFCTCNTMYRV